MLTAAFFGLLSAFSIERFEESRWLLQTAFWVFVVAAISDAVDGYLARAMKQITSFGRVVDPVADKVLICGAFVFFASVIFVDPQTHRNVTGVAPWMVIVVLLRELLVSALRAFSEAGGGDFSADWSGKIKMIVQSITASFILASLAFWPENTLGLRRVLVWLTVVVTALSIITYLRRAWPFMFARGALARDPSGDDTTSHNSHGVTG